LLKQVSHISYVFLKALNEAELTIWLPDKAPVIASGKVLGLLLGFCYWDSFV
jgi:hypothetical protein